MYVVGANVASGLDSECGCSGSSLVLRDGFFFLHERALYTAFCQNGLYNLFLFEKILFLIFKNQSTNLQTLLFQVSGAF